jgi:hypothetical protein
MKQFDITQLNKELDAALVDASQYHSDMDRYLNFYKNSAFFGTKTGQARVSGESASNLLRVFANANINFTSAFPTIKVPTTGATPEQRTAASLREKILMSVWKKSSGRMLQRKWSKDGTLLSMAIAETGYDIAARSAYVRRYDPRYCFWQLSNGNEPRVTAFWAVVPITADEAFKKYGVRPTGNGGLSRSALSGTFLNAIDGKDWFLQAIRWDDETRTAWVGDMPVEEPHKHNLGGIPIDMCVPFDELDAKGKGAFYLDPLVAPQANLNRTVERRDALVSRYANPIAWGRGVVTTQLDDVKQGMKNGGFIGLKKDGELGVLQIREVGILREQEEALRQDMLRLSGFSAAAMGELAGANTSGDALGMYFTPTQRHIEHQNIAWISFYESINAKILRTVERFAKTGEEFSVAGYSARGTMLPMADQPDKLQYQSGGFAETFDARKVIDGNYNSIVVMSAITPKNEIEEKRLVMDMMNQKVLSRTTGFEMIGIDSPEDELALLKQEQSEPELNPQGMQQLVQAAQTAQQTQSAAALPPTPSPVAGELKNDVRQPVQ